MAAATSSLESKLGDAGLSSSSSLANFGELVVVWLIRTEEDISSCSIVVEFSLIRFRGLADESAPFFFELDDPSISEWVNLHKSPKTSDQFLPISEAYVFFSYPWPSL